MNVSYQEVEGEQVKVVEFEKQFDLERAKFGVELETIMPEKFCECLPLASHMDGYYDDLKVEATSFCNDIRKYSTLDIEYDSYTHAVKNRWKMVYDSSLTCGGVEIVSPPLVGSKGLKQIYRMLSSVQELGSYPNISCGFHVHVDVHDFKEAGTVENGFVDLNQCARAMLLYEKYKKVIFKLVPCTSRTNNGSMYAANLLPNEYGKQWSALSNDDYDRMFKEAVRTLSQSCKENQLKENVGCDHYKAVSVFPLDRQGTIEYRQMGSTEEDYATHFVCWIVFCVCLTQKAKLGFREKAEVNKELTIEQLIRLIGMNSREDKLVYAIGKYLIEYANSPSSSKTARAKQKVIGLLNC